MHHKYCKSNKTQKQHSVKIEQKTILLINDREIKEDQIVEITYIDGFDQKIVTGRIHELNYNNNNNNNNKCTSIEILLDMSEKLQSNHKRISSNQIEKLYILDGGIIEE